MLLTDLGTQTMMEVIDRDHPGANLALYQQAVDALVAWQLASRPGVLPPYDEALLQRELALFPDWYVVRHRGVVLERPPARRAGPRLRPHRGRTTWPPPACLCTATSCRET